MPPGNLRWLWLARSFPRFALAFGFFALAAGPTALLAQTNIVTTLAGTAGDQGSIDGTGSAARFYEPNGVAVDGLGNVYVADRSNHTIRKITGGGIVTTLAGSPGLPGSANGTGSLARFNQPTGVAVDSVGNVYVADGGNHTIRKITGGGIVTTLAGTAGATGGNDATGAAAQFNEPRDVAVDSAGNVYVADYRNHTIRKITAGGVVTTLAGYLGVGGSTDGSGFVARFNLPSGVAVDSAGNVYVADSGNHTIRKVTSGGVVTTLAGTASLTGGSVNGTGAAARFNLPTGVVVDGGGTVYVADFGNHTIRRITSGGVVTTPVGTAGIGGVTDGAGPAGLLVQPWGVALGGANLYVTDPRNHTIRLVTDTPPAFKSASTASGMVAESFEYTIIVHGALTLSASGLPAGLSLDASSKVISGTATAAGAFPVTLTATNNNGSNTSTLTVTIAGIVAAERYTFTTLAGKAGSFGNVDATAGDARFGSLQRMAVDSAGNVYVAVGNDGDGDSIRKISRAGVVSTLAGGAGGAGSTDGLGSAARFRRPKGVAVDSAGNVYVADTENHTIRKITPAGLVSTLAGTAESEGSADGVGSAARFKYPAGVAVDSAGNIYVADTENNTIRKITSGGVVTTFAGSAAASGSTNGLGTAARFSGPVDVTVDGAGNVYVADNYSHIIRKITSSGTVTTLAGAAGLAGSAYGTGAAARFSSPNSVAVDSAGNVFVADSGNHTIRKIAISGLVTTVAGVAGSSGAVNGTGSVARFNNPFGIAVDSAGSVYVADQLNGTIRRGAAGAPVLRSASTASGQVGEPFAYAAILPGAMAISATDVPTGLTFDFNSAAISGTPAAAGTYPITFDASNSVGSLRVTVTLTVAARSPDAPSYTFSTLAGLAGVTNSTDGTGSAARFNTPTAVAADSAGNLYVADQGSHTIRKVTSAGLVSTLAGSAGNSGSTNGTGAAARFNYPAGLMVDTAGNVYVADTENHTIRKITSGGVVSTLAGTAGASGSTNSTGAAARFNSPTGLAMDAVGNIYVADSANNSIRVITPAGVVTTLAGETGPPGSADGTGGAARFNGPFGVAVDPVSKDVFVADTGNHTIRKITVGGVVTTLAGTAGSAGAAAGTGSAARFNSPYGIAVDRNGSLLVADSGNHTIRMIMAGAVATVGGAAGSPGAADAIGSATRFRLPRGIATDQSGNLYVADFENATIRKGVPSASSPTVTVQPAAQIAAAGTSVTLSVTATGTPIPTYQWRKDGVAIAGATASSLTLNTVSASSAGAYTVVITNSEGAVTSAAATLTVTGPSSAAPGISLQPVSQAATAGSDVTFSVTATGTPAPTYQWRKDGTPIAGATASSLTLTAVSASSAGSYTVVATNDTGSATSVAAILGIMAAGPTSALSNLSVRTTMASGQILIVGAVVNGGAKTILIRVGGPALSTFGLAGMADPRIELYTTGALPAATNDDWPAALSTTFSALGAFPFGSGSKDAALAQELNGLFTVQAKGTGPGTIIVEAYDVAGGVSPRLVNLSARSLVGTGDDILIAGFNVAGTGTKQVLIRAIGPGLAAFGVPGTLVDPKLQVFSAGGTVVAANDNWAAALAPTFAQVGAFPLPPASGDAALLVTLNAGTSYTVQVSGADGGTGEALIEVYEIF